jgi:hypothetical protein
MGHFEFRIMAFCLSGPWNFSKGHEYKFSTFANEVCIDILQCYSQTFKDHLCHLQQVFTLLSQEQWKIKLSKCTFTQNQVAYLGHLINSQGVATDPGKISAIDSWPQPKNVKELRRFFGLSRLL